MMMRLCACIHKILLARQQMKFARYCCGMWKPNVPQEVEHFHIFSDNAVGTNKNRFIFTICQFLYLTRFESMFEFPVPGHSFMCIDRSFALIEKKRKRKIELLHPQHGPIWS